MKIQRDIYYRILNDTPPVPPESGGIIGGSNDIITDYCVDSGIKSSTYFYYPDIVFLNKQLYLWQQKGINFYGIYHSHITSGYALSQTDKQYINLIMHSVSNITNSLYFPIILPKERIIAYNALLKDNRVVLSEEKITLVNKY